MKITLNVIGGEPLILNITQGFVDYYNNPSSYTAHIIDKEINNGHYNDPDFQKIFENKNAVVIDAGANIGLFSLLLYKVSKKIYAVEPTAEHLNVLKGICDYHKITNIDFQPIALNNYTGNVTFTIDHSNTTTNRIGGAGREVPCKTALQFIKDIGETEIDLLKLDIEGGELQVVLQDPTFAEAAKLCKNIYIEMHPPYVTQFDIINKFASLGFKTKFMNSEHLNNNLNLLAYK